jgi:hypothetical protein
MISAMDGPLDAVLADPDEKNDQGAAPASRDDDDEALAAAALLPIITGPLDWPDPIVVLLCAMAAPAISDATAKISDPERKKRPNLKEDIITSLSL